MEIVESVFKLCHIALENLLPMLHKKHKKSYIGAAISLVFLQRVYSYFRAPKHLRHMPIIPYFPMVKSLLNHELAYSRFKRLILPAIRENHGIYVSKVPLGWTVYIANPMIAKYVLFHTGTLQYTYPKSHDMLTKLGSDSPLVQLIGYDNILISNGHLWKNQRKLVNPAFHRSMPIKTVSSVIFDLFSAIEKENGTISIATKMKDFTLDALGLTLFGFDFKALKGDPDEWTKVFRQGIQVAMDPFLNVLSPFYSVLSFIFPEKRRQMKAVIKLNGKMDQMIKQKHTEVLSGAYSDIPENEKDLVVLMLEAERRGEGITNDLQLRNNMALLLLAGHDTTATALSFCFYNIAKNKHVQQKLREEIIGVLGDEPVDIVPTLEQLKKMSYLNLVIQEVENMKHMKVLPGCHSATAPEDVLE
ncbi:hypothetical protein G6F43_003416 [Rhizopus delemar]|nr:hypothetical protein G6F43_003416 [Rhizopus delemar]